MSKKPNDEETRKSIGRYEANLPESERNPRPKETVDKLIELSAQPIASVPERPQSADSYSGKQTRSRKAGGTSAKRSGKSRR